MLFGGLKMRFLQIRETHGSRELTFVWAHFLHFCDMKMWFLITVSSLYSGRRDTTKKAFSCHQNGENVITPTYVTLRREFSNSAEITFSGPKIKGKKLKNAMYHWTEDFTNRKNTLFLDSKMKKMSWRILRVRETVGLRTRQKSHFQPPKI